MSSENNVVSHVLSNFDSEEAEIMEKAIPAAIEAIETILSEGITAAMNKYNKREKEKPQKQEDTDRESSE
jgi:PTH1 family peptidyl-tRNA hydrolase